MPRPKLVAPTQPRRAPPRYAAPAVDKALDILEYLSAEAVPLTQAELARGLQRRPGELFRMLTCLEGRGYLWRDPATGAYALTLKLFELSRTHSPHQALLQAAVPHMRVLAEKVRESCHLSVLHRGKVLVLAQEESSSPFRLSVAVGSLHPLTRTTSGRLLLAHMDEPARQGLLSGDADFARRSARDREAFLARLAAIRERGHEQTEAEWFEGSVDLGVPVGSARSQVKAALVIAVLRRNDHGPLLEKMLGPLRRCARDIGLAAGILHPSETRSEGRGGEARGEAKGAHGEARGDARAAERGEPWEGRGAAP